MEGRDIPEVLEIDRSSFTLPWTERAYRYEVEENKAARCWVATLDDRVVAILVLWIILDEAHIATVATHPHFRRQGLGSRLLTRALVSAREEGTVKALLEVRARHTTAQKLYRDLGFVEVGRRPKYYHDNDEDALLMTLDNLKDLEYAEAE
jgi:ribosomal-protein-alanine N-acetyltransferase